MTVRGMATVAGSASHRHGAKRLSNSGAETVMSHVTGERHGHDTTEGSVVLRLRIGRRSGANSCFCDSSAGRFRRRMANWPHFEGSRIDAANLEMMQPRVWFASGSARLGPLVAVVPARPGLRWHVFPPPTALPA